MLTGMDKACLYSILKAPVVTEKSMKQQTLNTLVFKVLPDANKQEIKYAVEQIFDVKVKSVRTLNMQGKLKRTGNRLGRRQDWKKAYVSLMPGQSIEDITSEAE